MNTSPNKKSKFWRKQKWIKIIIIFIIFLLLLVISGFVFEWIASKNSSSKYPPPGKMVDIGGYRLHIHKQGTGSPIILLESGSGESSLSWRNIPTTLSKSATVVSYDRAGYAWSDESPLPRTGDNIVKELHTALDQANIKGPYILVGHSLGGMYSRLFAQKYQNEVAGIVLIDARPENDANRTEPIYQKEKPKSNPSPLFSILLKESGAFRLFPNFLLTGRVEKEDRKDFVHIVASSKYFRAVAEEGDLATSTENEIRNQKLGDIPVRVIARGQEQDLTKFGISQQANDLIEQSWQLGQREMLNISINSQFIIAKQSEHMIIHTEPDLVVKVIEELIKNIKLTQNK
ncbi:alpha/beta fold hydrolase [Paenibacillus nuruki]|uniref:alpha/beta fold hydrolase n=1 Tax=Paenibacillus nuruki TaxID=1886670 RepID=UPI00291E157B|nr:Alpha/beta hydrolase [Paenibacillus nuruki]